MTPYYPIEVTSTRSARLLLGSLRRTQATSGNTPLKMSRIILRHHLWRHAHSGVPRTATRSPLSAAAISIAAPLPTYRPIRTIAFVDPRTLLTGTCAVADRVECELTDAAYDRLATSAVEESLNGDGDPGNSWSMNAKHIPVYE